ncbi:MAG: hypothetical protein ACKV2Q_12240 [Planctomycetaceae bacterium]
MTIPPSSDAERVLPHVVYADELRSHAVKLIWLGHQRLDAVSFATTDEDVITEKLVVAMKAAQADESSPSWVDRYEIHEQRPQNVESKHGKHRPKMDIEFERPCRGFRPRLGFEAKRLRKSSGLRDYLGEEGMAAFLNGYYPTTHGEAGMLGYVQDSSTSDWATRIEYQLVTSGGDHRVIVDRHWKRTAEPVARPWYESRHTDLSQAPLRVIHVLLPFC